MTPSFNQLVNEVDWNDYKNWLFANKEKSYASKLFRHSQKFWNLGFTDELVTMESNRTRIEILKAIANLSRYLDIHYDTNFHPEFNSWLRKKEIHWTTKRTIDNYQLGKRLDIKTIIEKLRTLPERYFNYGLFALVTGLRTVEGFRAFNNHDKLCNDGIMELFWDRKTKKANAVFCHPLLHDKINHTISRKVYRYINKNKLGFELRDLRKLNFTMVATKVDPLLAEFMQGRRGNISQRHYFLPLMKNHKRKWINLWSPLLS